MPALWDLEQAFDGLPDDFSRVSVLNVQACVIREHAPFGTIIDEIPTGEIGCDEGDLLGILMSEGEDKAFGRGDESSEGSMVDAVEEDGFTFYSF